MTDCRIKNKSKSDRAETRRVTQWEKSKTVGRGKAKAIYDKAYNVYKPETLDKAKKAG